MIKAIITSLIVLSSISAGFSQDYELMNTAETYTALSKMHRGLRVLYIAAHPDDENTRLIAWLENEKHIETAYLSLTRGQGGQNLIGDEKGDALGVIRTYELLEARKIDGGEQMFTRAVDFGYSKSAKESFSKWGKEEVLSDVVYAIRKFRPHVIITRFPPNRNAGHGHHEASAIVAAEAFDLAGQSDAFPEHLDRVDPWKPGAMYFNTSSWWRKELDDKTESDLKKEKMHRVNIGVYNPITGLAMNEIASLARSKHRCQAFGTSRDRGERFEYLELLKGEWSENLFDDLEGVWTRSAVHKEALGSILDQYSFVDPEKNYALFVKEFEPKMAQRNMWAESLDMKYVADMASSIKQSMLGVRIEAYAGQEPVIVGNEFQIKIEAYNGGSESVQIQFTEIPFDTTFDLGAGKRVIFKRGLLAPQSPSTPYWLRNPHDDLYTIGNPKWMCEPRLVEREISYTIKRDLPIRGKTEFHRKWTDRSVGEIVQPLQFVPLVSLSNASKTLIVPNGNGVDNVVSVHAFGPVLDLKLYPIAGVEALAIAGVSIEKGQKYTASIKHQSGSESGQQHIIASEASIGNMLFFQTIRTIEYDHIPNISIAEECNLKLITLDLKKSDGKILYIEGSGDEVDESLENIGYTVDRLPLSEVADDLQQYKAIIVGIRAYNTNDALIAYHNKLMEYVNDGGNMIVQYNTSRGLKMESFGPTPFKLGRERVTEENATATLLQPNHSVFTKPNKLSDTDFEDWVQERGLYFASEWDEHYTPLISWKDSDEKKDSKGGLIVTHHGKGSYFYSGISFFRQLPAGVPGAYKLLVNMIEYQP
jgi:LmbE family N-acetylglucosaminyl deacetylase